MESVTASESSNDSKTISNSVRISAALAPKLNRRLNVDVIRALHELCVFSSLSPEPLDLSRTQAKGMHDLKHFLKFAERGARAQVERVSGSLGDFDSPFEEAVADALRRKGWQVHSQVSVPSFRIDLGVVDPDAPGHYLAGVECDGATYHRSATARDKLREQVLRDLGWEIVRIWSTDGWHDAAGALDKVHAQLQTLLEQQRAKRAEIEKLAAAKIAEKPKISVEAEPEPLSLVAGNVALAAPAEGDNANPTTHDIFGQNLFIEADPTEAIEQVNPGAFLDNGYDATLNAMIALVVNREGPVREDVLAKRIARAHVWARTGKRIRDRVYLLAEECYPSTTEEVGQFFWPEGSDTSQWPQFRYSENGARAVDEICIQELRALEGEVGCQGDSDEARIATMAGLIGVKWVTADVKGRLVECLDVSG